jgi:ABC-type polysaccharide/polyol phosphate export permease
MAVGVSRWRTSYGLALQDIELRYRRSLLGPFWISAALVATVLALAFVFAEVFRTEFVTYVSFIGAGLLAWQLILALVNEGCGSITEHTGFLQNVHMPTTVIAGRIAIRNAIVLAHNLVAMLALLLIFGSTFSLTALLVVPGALVILCFGYFLSIALGPICARFRDIPLVIQSAMQVIFFLTPIFWMPSSVSHRPMFTAANPFYHMIELIRAPLLGELPTELNWRVAMWCCGAAMILAVVSVSLTRRKVNLWL